MSITVTQKPNVGAAQGLVRHYGVGNEMKSAVFEVTMDSSYPTDGEAFLTDATISKFFDAIDFVAITPDAGVLDNVYTYDYTNNKIKAYVMSTGLEVANGVDLSADILRVLVLGRKA